ncbi:hypothetical protein C8J56DRAFT_1173442 [Mycena floridula]|nr:hypothetical protein C8J56DRAFT_1173442 [Mycena floridula]
MPSFKTLAVFFALAVSTFTLAAPVAQVETRAPVAVAVRDDSSLATILGDLNSKLGPISDSFRALNSANATADNVTPLANAMEDALNVALTEINALAADPAAAVTGLLGDLTSIGGLVNLIVQLLSTVFGALGLVMSIATSTNLQTIQPILEAVGKVAGDLVTVVLKALPVGGLANTVVGLVTPLLGDVLSTVSALNVTSLTSILGL